MAHEFTLITKTHNAIPFTVANTGGIEKGTMCTLSDLMTAAAVSASGSLVAGISASEKISGDGKTKLGLFRGGIFKGYASGSIAVGAPLRTTADDNLLAQAADDEVSGSAIVGTSFEAVAETESFKFELKPMIWMT